MYIVDTLLYIVFGTLIVFLWLFTKTDSLAKCFFGLFILTYLVYSGIGGALEDANPSYVVYYFIFSIFVSLGIFWSFRIVKSTTKNRKYLSWFRFFDYFIDKYATKIIIAYFILNLSSLVYPEFKLLNLISPPAPDVISMLGERYNGGETNIISSIINGLNNLIYPFFLFSFYKYRKNTLALSFIIFFNYYIEYCANSYIGRGTLMTGLIIVGAFTYFYRPKLGKRLLYAAIFVIPFLLTFLVQYSITRIGGSATDISASDALETLMSQEGSYPLHFTQILNSSGDYTLNYLVWLFTMPLPGFFRGGLDANFNAIISEYLLGMNRTDRGFFILLPGIVGESVFLMGKSLFWVNGLIYGFLMGACYKVLSRYPQLFGLLVSAAICFGYTMNRGGLSSGIPLILKIFVYFTIIMWIVKQKNSQKVTMYYNSVKNRQQVS